ncbi:MAG: hypothetical protein M1828_003827 [Chrysothrix sp. TS-e1954]|nr:MAG: hypothetical protein M1828_003827 [Chrysothrix sp. TS-e1954]
MLTKVFEQGREKCYQYYPEDLTDPEFALNAADEAPEDDSFNATVTLLESTWDEQTRSTLRKMHLTSGDKTKVIWHYLFEGWPDFATPEDENKVALLQLVKESANKTAMADESRFIHCSAGVGRTGTFIALDHLLSELNEGAFDRLPDDKDPITEVVDDLRKQRMMMVQGELQYHFLFAVLKEQWLKRHGIESEPTPERRFLGNTRTRISPGAQGAAFRPDDESLPNSSTRNERGKTSRVPNSWGRFANEEPIRNPEGREAQRPGHERQTFQEPRPHYAPDKSSSSISKQALDHESKYIPRDLRPSASAGLGWEQLPRRKRPPTDEPSANAKDRKNVADEVDESPRLTLTKDYGQIRKDNETSFASAMRNAPNRFVSFQKDRKDSSDRESQPRIRRLEGDRSLAEERRAPSNLRNGSLSANYRKDSSDSESQPRIRRLEGDRSLAEERRAPSNLRNESLDANYRKDGSDRQSQPRTRRLQGGRTVAEERRATLRNGSLDASNPNRGDDLSQSTQNKDENGLFPGERPREQRQLSGAKSETTRRPERQQFLDRRMETTPRPQESATQDSEGSSYTAETTPSVFEAPVLQEFQDRHGERRRPDRANREEPRSRNHKKDRRADKFALDDEDFETPIDSRKEQKEKRKKEKAAARKANDPIPIEIPPFISVSNLATALGVRQHDFIEMLDELGFEEVAGDHVLNAENAGLVAMEYGFEPIIDRSEEDDIKARPAPEDKTQSPLRPPVVTIMGHVDHGKTTILDFLRKSSVAASEHGGITQHIGAFSVPMASGRTVTFLDTPGHAAFLTMRQRGANVTDIVILVIAADDSIKPQTIEAIKHAKAAQVPIIVAMNKVDKEEANIDRVKQDLLQHDLEVEDFGGDIQAIPLSGKTGQGIPELEDAIVTLAEILDLRAEASGAAEGWVLEAATKKAGRTATVLIKRGTLHVGDIIVAGTTWSRVRSLHNEAGTSVPEAGPGTPVEVDGWRDQPTAGDEVLQAPDESKATSVIDFREQRNERARATLDMEAINASRRLDAERREQGQAAGEVATKEYYAQSEATRLDISGRQAHEAKKRAIERVNKEFISKKTKENVLYFVIRADVGGSAEAVSTSLSTIPLQGQPVEIDIIRSGFGQLSESDIALASSAPADMTYCINFSQPVSPHIRAMAETAGVQILDETIIYKVIDRVREAVEKALPPIVSNLVTGEAVAAQLFDIREGKKLVKVAGCRVKNGTMTKASKVKVFREAFGNEAVCVYEGTLSQLKSHKRDVTSMTKGAECGVRFDDWDGFEVGDNIQCLQEIKEMRRLPTQ